ncbi:MAG TPA: secondary thiamine-phosphate synthase enzyme YjbQ [Conexibacter sp.]
MTVHHATIDVQSEARVTFHDVTDEVTAQLGACGVASGLAVVSSPHTTCSVLIQEASHDTTFLDVEYLMQDLADVLRRTVPDCTAEGQYLHPGPQHIEGAIRERSEEAWWSLNVDAHLRSVLLGRSESVPIVDGALALGEFGRIYFADFDQMRARPRRVHVTFVGESAV